MSSVIPVGALHEAAPMAQGLNEQLEEAIGSCNHGIIHCLYEEFDDAVAERKARGLPMGQALYNVMIDIGLAAEAIQQIEEERSEGQYYDQQIEEGMEHPEGADE